MLSICLLCLTCLPAQQADSLNATELANRLKEQHAALKDVEFFYEGEQRIVVGDPKNTSKLNRASQGKYAFRSDGATHLDLYEKFTRGEPDLFHTTRAMLNGELVEAQWNPGRKLQPGNPQKRPGGALATGGPELLFLLPFWEEFKRNPELWKVESKGTVNLDGHPVTLLWIDKYPESKIAPGLKKTERVWLDLNRGGHILRMESYQGPNLNYRMDGIELEKFEDGNKQEIWVPVRGRYQSFRELDEFHKEPVLEAKYQLDRDSIVINQGLRDTRFKVSWNGPTKGSKPFDQMRQEFDESRPKQLPTVATLPSDPESIHRYQAEKLEEADRQGARLDAAPEAQVGFVGRIGLSWILALLALVLLMAAVVLRRRSG